MNDFYVCPNCNHAGGIIMVTPLVGNVRYDTVRCPDCGSEWRVYYEVGQMNTEITRAPSLSEQSEPVDETPDE